MADKYVLMADGYINHESAFNSLKEVEEYIQSECDTDGSCDFEVYKLEKTHTVQVGGVTFTPVNPPKKKATTEEKPTSTKRMVNLS